MIGTPENPDILDYLDSGLDNVEKNAEQVELGGVLMTMNEAAVEIRLLRKAIVNYVDKSKVKDGERADVQKAIDRAFELASEKE